MEKARGSSGHPAKLSMFGVGDCVEMQCYDFEHPALLHIP
jgi:hypothetical protein